MNSSSQALRPDCVTSATDALWLRGQRAGPQEAEERRGDVSTSTLTIADVRAHHDGLYTCTAFNGVGVPDSSSLHLKVLCRYTYAALCTSKSLWVYIHSSLHLKVLCGYIYTALCTSKSSVGIYTQLSAPQSPLWVYIQALCTAKSSVSIYNSLHRKVLCGYIHTALCTSEFSVGTYSFVFFLCVFLLIIMYVIMRPSTP